MSCSGRWTYSRALGSAWAFWGSDEQPSFARPDSRGRLSPHTAIPHKRVKRSIGVVHDLSANDCRHDFSYEVPAVEGSVVRERTRLCGFEGPALLRIEDGHVGEVAACK